MSSAKKRLYELLPRYVRYRDYFQGKPLAALMDALEVPFATLEENIDTLYQGWFIETCDLWMVPYVADLVGLKGMERVPTVLPTYRTLAANTVAYRRRKGTPAAVARVAEAATGWPCHVVEYRHVIAITPSLRDLQHPPEGPQQGAWVDLRRAGDLERLGTPFNVIDHTVDLRIGEPGRLSRGRRGAFNLRTLELAFWRLQSYPVRGGTARRMTSRQPSYEGRLYTFHPFGLDTPLFNWPQSEDEPVHATEPQHLPAALRRYDLTAELAARRRGELPETDFFGSRPVFRVLVRGPRDAGFRAVAPEAMEICDLSRWRLPATSSSAEVAVDPVLGRLAFRDTDVRRRVRVDYCYGAPADLGGGPYSRRGSLHEPEEGTWQAVVCQSDAPPSGPGRYGSLADAVKAFAAGATAARRAFIRIADSGLYHVGGLEVVVPELTRLVIQADDGACPVLQGDLSVTGHRGSHLLLNGLWIDGRIRVRRDTELHLEHCTVNPPRRDGRPRWAIEGEGRAAGGDRDRRIEVRIRRCIVGALRLPRQRVALLEILDSIVDGAGEVAICGAAGGGAAEAPPAGPAAHLERSTIFGQVSLHQLWLASNVLFTGRVLVERPREGQVRYCYVPAGSITPPRELSLGGPQENLPETPPGAGSALVAPAFVSTVFGHPGYAQVSPCSSDILQGGEQADEIGVYHSLRQSYRLVSLPVALTAYIPGGLNARVSFVT